MKYLYSLDLKNKKELETLLAKDPYADDSFARLGYVLKESKVVGLKGGFLILYFKTDKVELADKLIEQLKTIPSFTEISQTDKETCLKNIEAEEENAASGFGSIFG